MSAAFDGHTDIVDVLLKKGADLHLKNAHGATALMPAAVEGHITTLQALIDAGADVNGQDNDERTALMSAIVAGHTHAVNVSSRERCRSKYQR